MKKFDKKELVLLLVILIIGVVLLVYGIKKLNNKTNQGNDFSTTDDQIQEEEYQVNIDSKDCLHENEINELIDLGKYAERPKMVYIGGDDNNPIEVWKIKFNEDDNVLELFDMMKKRKQDLIDSYGNGSYTKEIIENPMNAELGAGGNVVTLIISNHLEEVKEQTSSWLNE